jgi:uncharacterized membrane protein YphA (DoxX/SURF4 family)/peroxiredoxin
MDTVLVALRLLLAGVFVVAAVGKLLDLEGSRTAMRDFRVPERLQGVAAVALPLAELAVGVALVLSSTARWGAIGAMLLLLAFIGGITAALRRGQAPACHCFGQFHSEPAGSGTLVRNGLLLVVATFVAVAGPGPALDTWVSDSSVGDFVLAATIIVAVAVAIWAAAREADRRERARRFAKRLAAWESPAGLPIGSPAPAFELPTFDGSPLKLNDLTAAGRPVVLFFTHPGCGPCSRVLPKMAYWQDALGERVTIAVVTQGGVDENAPLSDELALRNVGIEEGTEVFDSYEVRGTPSLVVVNPDGTIASDTGAGEFVIEELLRLTVHRSGEAAAAAAA